MALVIHIGARKTASTSIQQLAETIKTNLSHSNIFYAGPPTIRTLPSWSEWWLSYYADDASPSRYDQACASLALELKERCNSFDHIILSEETFLHALMPLSDLAARSSWRSMYRKTGRLVNILSEQLNRVPMTTLSLRRQDRFLLSSWLHSIHRHGKSWGLKDYYYSEVYGHIESLSWCSLIDALKSTSGAPLIISTMEGDLLKRDILCYMQACYAPSSSGIPLTIDMITNSCLERRNNGDPACADNTISTTLAASVPMRYSNPSPNSHSLELIKKLNRYLDINGLRFDERINDIIVASQAKLGEKPRPPFYEELSCITQNLFAKENRELSNSFLSIKEPDFYWASPSKQEHNKDCEKKDETKLLASIRDRLIKLRQSP